MPFTRLPGTTLILCGLTALVANSAGAAGFRQVGWLRSDTRNLAVGNGEVRVVSRPDTESLDLSGDIREDRPKIERLYPGWDLLSDLVILYRATPDGFIQDSFYYESGVDRKPFPGDPIEPKRPRRGGDRHLQGRAGDGLGELGAHLERSLANSCASHIS